MLCAQNALNFNPKIYGPNVELKFTRRQPPAYTGPIEVKEELYQAGKNIIKNGKDVFIPEKQGTKLRFQGVDTYIDSSSPSSIKTLLKNTKAGRAAAKKK